MASLHAGDPGVLATNYAKKRLLEDLDPYDNKVALRVVPIKDHKTDPHGRVLVFMFHQALEGMNKKERKQFLLRVAGGFPDINWQAYTDEGLPYTFNQEMLAFGHASLLEPNSVIPAELVGADVVDEL